MNYLDEPGLIFIVFLIGLLLLFGAGAEFGWKLDAFKKKEPNQRSALLFSIVILCSMALIILSGLSLYYKESPRIVSPNRIPEEIMELKGTVEIIQGKKYVLVLVNAQGKEYPVKHPYPLAVGTKYVAKKMIGDLWRIFPADYKGNELLGIKPAESNEPNSTNPHLFESPYNKKE